MGTFKRCTSLTSIVLPENLIKIGNQAFEDCTSLENVRFGDNITTIESNAFKGCIALTSIVLGKEIATIGDCAFHDCRSLSSIIVKEGNKYYKSVNDVLFNKEGNILVKFPVGKEIEEFNIPSTVKKIEYGAFYGCKSLKSITFSKGLTEIEDYAFYGCSSIEYVNLPESLTKIGELAWGYCSSLRDITLPQNLKETGDVIFAGCENLTLLEPWMVGTWELSTGSIYGDGIKSELVCEISENGQTLQSMSQTIRHPNGLVYSYPPDQISYKLRYDRKNQELRGGIQKIEVNNSQKSLSMRLTENGSNYSHYLKKTSD
jgi:hypothetical protein